MRFLSSYKDRALCTDRARVQVLIVQQQVDLMLFPISSTRMRERGRDQPDPPVAAAGGGVEALALGEDMSMMAATKSGSEKRASGGGEVLSG